ncbi:hypothetical protein [Streptomyces incarnatus]|uniref:hypothetical protein n=1 Tax=Streptomyces incarnatus TaxID=665007 RepID=UPI000B08F5C6|nr:hypothetical protein [Streptomyces incarnatus]
MVFSSSGIKGELKQELEENSGDEVGAVRQIQGDEVAGPDAVLGEAAGRPARSHSCR